MYEGMYVGWKDICFDGTIQVLVLEVTRNVQVAAFVMVQFFGQ